MCYLLVTPGRLPAHLGKLLQAMREIVGGGVSEAELRTSTKWALAQVPLRKRQTGPRQRPPRLRLVQ